MGHYFSCCNQDLLVMRVDTEIDSDIDEIFAIQPSLLSSDIGIKRRALKRPGLQEAFTVTSIYKKNTHEFLLLQREASLIKTLNHPNIIKFEAIFEDNTVFHLVTEEVNGVTLLDLLLENQQLNELNTRKIIKQILRAIQYLHLKGICYGNICMDTIKVYNNKVKLINFTKARKVKDEGALSIGNYNFMAPECFAESYNEKSDMWSVGVVTYFLLTGRLPFEGCEKVEIIANIGRGRYNCNGLTDGAKVFINALIVANPENRLSADEALKSHWLTLCTDLN